MLLLRAYTLHVERVFNYCWVWSKKGDGVTFVCSMLPVFTEVDMLFDSMFADCLIVVEVMFVDSDLSE